MLVEAASAVLSSISTCYVDFGFDLSKQRMAPGASGSCARWVQLRVLDLPDQSTTMFPPNRAQHFVMVCQTRDQYVPPAHRLYCNVKSEVTEASATAAAAAATNHLTVLCSHKNMARHHEKFAEILQDATEETTGWFEVLVTQADFAAGNTAHRLPARVGSVEIDYLVLRDVKLRLA